MNISVYKDLTSIHTLRDPWDGLVTHPNADLDHYITIVNSRRPVARPYVITFTDQAKVRTIIAARHETSRLAATIGYLNLKTPSAQILTIIYGGIIGDQSPEILHLLSDYLDACLRQKLFDVISLPLMDRRSSTYTHFAARFSLLRRDPITRTHIHWRQSVPDGIDKHLSELSPNHKRKLKQTQRKLEREKKVDIVYYRNDDNLAKVLKDIEAIASHTYHRGLNVGFINNVENIQRVKLFAQRRSLLTLIMYIDGQPASLYMATLYKSKMYLEYTGYDPQYSHYEPSKLLFRLLMDIARNSTYGTVTEIDFGSGDATYKRVLCDVRTEETDIYIYARRPLAFSLWLLRLATALVSHVLCYALTKLNAQQSMKTTWRRLLTPAARRPITPTPARMRSADPAPES